MWNKAILSVFLTATLAVQLQSAQAIPPNIAELPPFLPLSEPRGTLEVSADDADDWVQAELQAEGRNFSSSYQLVDSDEDEVVNVGLLAATSE